VDFEVVWSESASTDLQAIIEGIAENNPAAAERLAATIMERVDLLRTVPFMGAPYPKGSQGRHRTLVCGNYRVFYRVVEKAERVEIVSIWHGARQEPELPP
jgi:plasmid stabilization system protein ParE